MNDLLPDWFLNLFGIKKEPPTRNISKDRVNPNNSQTKKASTSYENGMYKLYPKSFTKYDVPYIPEKKIMLNGYTTSTNALDSIAKYAGIHNRNLKLALKPLKGTKTTRKVSKEEALGLPEFETHFGALSYVSEPAIRRDMKKRGYSDEEINKLVRAFYNANVFTAFKNVPAITLVNDYHYNLTDLKLPPLLDAFRYYAEGDYNRGRGTHSSEVKNAGTELFKLPEVLKWWNTSGKDYFEGKRQ